MKVAIQGIEGCFHQVAANKYFGKKIEPVCCMSFSELIKKVENAEADYGIMAIENSIAGSILPNYDILLQSKLSVTGEYYLHIAQNIMALPGTGINDIEMVYSHPMAFYQCRNFLNLYNFKLVEKEDTALSAKLLRDGNIKNVAAIASELAAELYNLNILQKEIQTNEYNYTRFVVLDREENFVKDSDKASICFTTPNTPGSLASVLNIINEFGINLSKLQSNPIIGQSWKYFFFADMENINEDLYKLLINTLKNKSVNIIELGRYKNGLKL